MFTGAATIVSETKIPLGSLFLDPQEMLSLAGSETCSSLSCNCLTVCLCALSHVRLLLSMGFSGQDSWSGLPFPPPGDLPDSETEPMSPALASGFFTT